MENNYLLYRFLREHKFDVDKAQVALENNFEFRRKHNLDTILEDYKPDETWTSYFPLNFLGLDKEGGPLLLADAGNTDILGLLKSHTQEDIVKYLLYNLERMQTRVLEQTRKLKKPSRCTVILDYENATLAKIISKSEPQILGARLLNEVVQLSIDVLLTADANYPKLIKTLHIINAPIYFSYLFNIWKKILHGELIRTINIYGKDDWRDVLLNQIDPEELPAYLGGEIRDPDGNPQCVKTLLRGKPVPKHYYLDHSVNHLRNQPDAERYTLGPRSKITVIHEVDIPGSFLEWQFESENHDIGFGLFFKPGNDENPKELIPIERVKANVQREVGTFMCSEPGTYRWRYLPPFFDNQALQLGYEFAAAITDVRFHMNPQMVNLVEDFTYIMTLDNSYSWLRGKHIFIKSSVHKTRKLVDTNIKF